MNDESNAVALATELTIAWLSNPNTRADQAQVPEFLQSMHQAVSALREPPAEAPAAEDEAFTPAVSVRKSLARPDSIISMIDGKPYKTLRRHLAGYGLTPEQYRERYNLKPDYPMVAPEYSEARRAMAKKIGLGRKADAAPAKASATGAAEPAAKPRRRKSTENETAG